MRCTAYLTAGSYNLPALFEFLKSKYPVTRFREAIAVSTTPETGEIFFFPYGVIVLWGFSDEEEEQFLLKLTPYEIDKLSIPLKEDNDFAYSEITKIQRGEIFLSNSDMLTKLAISFGLAQSSKLSLFEETIDKTIVTTRQLPKDLAAKGKIMLSRKELAQKIGQLFIDKSSVNLHSDILDEPDFFWEYPELLPYYQDTIKCLDLRTRIEVLNQRLTVLGDLLGILSDQLDHRQTVILEWAIVLLIVIEVVLALLRDLFHLI